MTYQFVNIEKKKHLTELYVIEDALQPRNVMEALLEAGEIALKL